MLFFVYDNKSGVAQAGPVHRVNPDAKMLGLTISPMLIDADEIIGVTPFRSHALLQMLRTVCGTTQKISAAQQLRQLTEGQETRRARRCHARLWG